MYCIQIGFKHNARNIEKRDKIYSSRNYEDDDAVSNYISPENIFHKIHSETAFLLNVCDNDSSDLFWLNALYIMYSEWIVNIYTN